MKIKTCFGRSACAMAAIAIIGFAIPARAESVLIDFGSNTSFRGVSVANPDTNGNYWTSMQPGLFYTNLVDTTNTATTIDFGFSTGVATDSYNGPAGVTSDPPTPGEIAATDIDAAALGDLGVINAAFDFAAGPGGATRFEIQELDPTKTYNLTFFGSHKYSANNTTVYSVYTDNTYSSLVDSASLLVGVNDIHNRDMVATINGLSPQASNILYVEFIGNLGGDGYLNAMKIEIVPEPGSLLLVAGGLGLICLRRRRS